MKKYIFGVFVIISLYISYVSFRLSIPYYEINQILATKQILVSNGTDLNAGGVVIFSVSPDSPASESGIEPYYQITQINGRAVGNADEFLRAIRNYSGMPVALTVCQSHVCKEVVVTPREDPPMNHGPLGIEIQNVSLYDRSTMQVILEQLYNRFIGGDVFSAMFGPHVMIISWIFFVIGIASLILPIIVGVKAFRT